MPLPGIDSEPKEGRRKQNEDISKQKKKWNHWGMESG
jgi:hypothetical protein